MDRKISRLWTLLAALAILLASCRPASTAEPTATQLDPAAVFTAAAHTADAKMTELAAITPTQPPATDTPAPPTDTLAPTQAPLTATLTLAPTNPPPSAGSDRAEFVADITVPDGTNYDPGDTFVKTWELKNAGTTTWTTGYSLVFVSGSQMGGPASVPLTGEVAPGQTVNVSVNQVAPNNAGNYKGFWRMSNASGKLFDTSVYVEINVTGAGGSATNTPGTPGVPTVTSTPGSGAGVLSDVTISVDDANVEDTCPHTFTFTAHFKLSKASQVSYRLEALTGYDINLPDPVTENYGAGSTDLVYNLEFTASVSGWAQLHITAPADVVSNQANFTLTCK